MTTCAWCGASFPANSLGRPRRYCGVPCRRRHAAYVESLPGWTARLAELEASAAGYRGGTPVFIRNELDALRAAIADGPKGGAPCRS